VDLLDRGLLHQDDVRRHFDGQVLGRHHDPRNSGSDFV
jgi:hypothetical protein